MTLGLAKNTGLNLVHMQMLPRDLDLSALPISFTFFFFFGQDFDSLITTKMQARIDCPP